MLRLVYKFEVKKNYFDNNLVVEDKDFFIEKDKEELVNKNSEKIEENIKNNEEIKEINMNIGEIKDYNGSFIEYIDYKDFMNYK